MMAQPGRIAGNTIKEFDNIKAPGIESGALFINKI
jgi:hypothetical protein